VTTFFIRFLNVHALLRRYAHDLDRVAHVLALVARGSPTPIIDSAPERRISSAFFFFFAFSLGVRALDGFILLHNAELILRAAREGGRRADRRNSPSVVFFFLGRDSWIYHCLRTRTVVPIWNDDHDSRFVRKTQPIFPELPRPRRPGFQFNPHQICHSRFIGVPLWRKPRILRNEFLGNEI